MENPHGSQAFFNGLKEDSFSKDDQWVEQVSMDSIDPTKIWVWINTYKNTIFRGMNIHKSQLF
jgi:hypothetical protein